MQNHGTEECPLYNYGTTAHINFDDEPNGKKIIPASKSDWKDERS